MTTTTTWDDVADTVTFSVPLDIDFIAERIPPQSRILDLGCGYGRTMASLRARGFCRLIGYDASPQLVARGHSQTPDLDLRVADATHLPDSSDTFDAVVIAALLTSVPCPRHQTMIVAEIARVLRPGGEVFGVDFLRDGDAGYLSGGRFRATNGISMIHFKDSELSALFQAFTIVESKRIGISSLSSKPAEVLQYAFQLRR
ncbi:MAG: class I SAM-dependent methyltransferase [Halomonas sp.]|uniref:class I SAM-dependent methyltransferase n=1 Tax=Halomonas sp. TaxID=1486246 RepID=UPI003F90D9E6